MKVCPNCGKKYKHDEKYCGECGEKLIKFKDYCPKCKLTFSSGKFCTKCGEKLINKEDLEKYQEEETKKLKKRYSRLISCPKCGGMIKKSAVRCKHCKTMLKEYK